VTGHISQASGLLSQFAQSAAKISDTMLRCDADFNLLAPELFFLILAHPVYKM